MSGGIRSLADELREQLRSGGAGEPDNEVPVKEPAPKSKSPPKKTPERGIPEQQAADFFTQLEAFAFSGTEKSMIRVDTKTMNLLKRIKLAKGIDMNKFIVYSLHHFIGQHPWLAPYIQETLKNTDL